MAQHLLAMPALESAPHDATTVSNSIQVTKGLLNASILNEMTIGLQRVRPTDSDLPLFPLKVTRLLHSLRSSRDDDRPPAKSMLPHVTLR
jgi:hypothetical protein